MQDTMKAAAAAQPGQVHHEAAWQSTITRISSAIVNIRISSVRSIEAERASYGYATGFVGEYQFEASCGAQDMLKLFSTVDSARGLILSNRHVVGIGTKKHARL